MGQAGLLRLTLFLFHSVTVASVGLLQNAYDSQIPVRMLPSSNDCQEHWFEQQVDHFSWIPPPGNRTTFFQRYFVCHPPTLHATKAAPKNVFYYFGNEDNVELYVNNTGLMWESAEEFAAVMVFAEHRFYGKTLPFPANTKGCMSYLTTEQALADSASILSFIRAGAKTVGWKPGEGGIVGFGGSYGGMMAAWFRLKYPHLIDGVVAASAPILAFLGMHPPYNSGGFQAIVSQDASSAGGATDNCRRSFRAGQPLIDSLADTEAGRLLLSKSFRTCQPLHTAEAARGLISWIQEPWAWLAMGDFPYASGYLLHGHGTLPPWPVRAACQPLDLSPSASTEELLEGMRAAAAVYFNHSGTVTCFYNGAEDQLLATRRQSMHAAALRAMSAKRHREGVPEAGAEACTGDWDYQWCTEMVMPFSSDGVHDMFWPPVPFDLAAATKRCQEQWGVTPRPEWVAVQYGGHDLGGASNIVFSNGRLDPWMAGGVLKSVSDSVVALIVEEGAHHLDLMFSHPDDPDQVKQVRATEREHIRRWVAQAQHTPQQERG